MGALYTLTENEPPKQLTPMPRIPIKITPHPYLSDHHFMGQPVLPAVEAMEILAAVAKHTDPQRSVTTISNARFDKFLPIDHRQSTIEAFADMENIDNGIIQTQLATKTRAPKAKITRTKIHAQLSFDADPAPSDFVPLDLAGALEGTCISVEPDKIYSELVPFGPAYANITEPLWLSPDGALAAIECTDRPTTSGTNHLGAPFILDAAFHAACVWGQHFHNVVAFPVGMGQRRVLHPTQPDSRYFGRVGPKTITPSHLIFDIVILDASGRVCEAILDLQMRDVSGGRLKPPEWIVRNDLSDPLAAFRRHCQGLVVIELAAVTPFATAALTKMEAERTVKMAPRRKKSFLAARLALKRLSRQIQSAGNDIDPRSIHTVSNDGVRPCCPVEDGNAAPFCSVSHDRRFAIAVAADQPIGVDVEVISEKTVKCSRIYMSDRETALMNQSRLGAAQAATRIWSLKEAVAKATGVDLATAWRIAQIRSIGEDETRFDLDGKGSCVALHAVVGTHLFTLYDQ